LNRRVASIRLPRSNTTYIGSKQRKRITGMPAGIHRRTSLTNNAFGSHDLILISLGAQRTLLARYACFLSGAFFYWRRERRRAFASLLPSSWFGTATIRILCACIHGAGVPTSRVKPRLAHRRRAGFLRFALTLLHARRTRFNCWRRFDVHRFLPALSLAALIQRNPPSIARVLAHRRSTGSRQPTLSSQNAAGACNCCAFNCSLLRPLRTARGAVSPAGRYLLRRTKQRIS